MHTCLNIAGIHWMGIGRLKFIRAFKIHSWRQTAASRTAEPACGLYSVPQRNPCSQLRAAPRAKPEPSSHILPWVHGVASPMCTMSGRPHAWTLSRASCHARTSSFVCMGVKAEQVLSFLFLWVRKPILVTFRTTFLWPDHEFLSAYPCGSEKTGYLLVWDNGGRGKNF